MGFEKLNVHISCTALLCSNAEALSYFMVNVVYKIMNTYRVAQITYNLHVVSKYVLEKYNNKTETKRTL